MITFFASGMSADEAGHLMDKAHPILAAAGMPVEVCTVLVVPAIIRDYREEKTYSVSEKTFWFPSFEALREKGHDAVLAMAKKLQGELGVVCHTIEAPVVASFD